MEILSEASKTPVNSMIMPALCDHPASDVVTEHAGQSLCWTPASLEPSCGLLIPGVRGCLLQRGLDISSEILKWRGVI